MMTPPGGTTASCRVGCSGWSYRDWRGRLYPSDQPSSTWFGHYAQHFDTVELNNTFYRLPPESTVTKWATQAPPGFCYAVKVGGYGSHRKKLKDPEGWLGTHVERMAPLGDHLGPNLVQLPPHWSRDVGRLRTFLDCAPPAWRWAVELRDPSWLHDDVYAALADHDAALCMHDLLPGQPWIRTASWAYVRFHGPAAVTARYSGHYGGRHLWRTADRLSSWLAEGADVYAYFNNDMGGAAVDDATWLRERLLRGPAGRAAAPSRTT